MAALLDLKRVNATMFRLDVACWVNGAIRTELERITGKPLEVDKGGSFGVISRRGEDECVDFAYFEYVEAEGPHLHATFMYGLKDIPRPPRSMYKPYKLLQILSMADKPLTFICNLSFLYEKGTKKSIIQLPIPVFSTDKANFHEIKGLELSRTEPQDSKYNIRISMMEDRSMLHEVSFNFEAKARLGIEGSLLKKAVKISHQFLE